MTPRTHTPPAITAGLIKIGPHDVRVRPHRGVSTPPWLWDVLDLDERTGQLVTVASYCSWPDEDALRDPALAPCLRNLATALTRREVLT